MKILEVLLLSLATWRMASLLVNEEGPFRVFERIREWVGIRGPEVPDRFLAGVLSCVWCCSLWVGAGWTILFYLFPNIVGWLAFPFALSAVAIGVDRFLGAK